MNLLTSIILGTLVGWLGAKIAGRDENPLASMVIGIVGSVIGGVLYYIFSTGPAGSYEIFTWSGLVWSFFGAIIFSICLNVFETRGQHHRS